MTASHTHPIVHFVGSVPLPDAETVFRTSSAATRPHLLRLPDGCASGPTTVGGAPLSTRGAAMNDRAASGGGGN